MTLDPNQPAPANPTQPPAADPSPQPVSGPVASPAPESLPDDFFLSPSGGELADSSGEPPASGAGSTQGIPAPPDQSGQPAASGQAGGGEPPVSPVFAAAQELGIDTSGYASEADLVREMYGAFSDLHGQQTQLRQLATIGQQAAADWEAYQAWRTQQAASQPPRSPGAAAPATSPVDELAAALDQAWGIPPWKPEWKQAARAGVIVRDENGLWQAAAGREIEAATIVGPLNAREVQQRQAMEDYFAQGNPLQLIAKALPVMKQQWQADIEAAVEARFQERVRDDELARAREELAPHIYEQRDGKPVVGSDGKYRLNAYGTQLYNTLAELEQSGITDPMRAIQLAKRLNPLPAAGANGNGTPAAPATPAAAPAATPKTPLADVPEGARQQGGQPAALPAHAAGLPEGYTVAYRGPDGKLLSAEQIAQLQQSSFLDRAAAAAHNPGVTISAEDQIGRTPGGPTEAQLERYFLDA